MNRTQLLNIRVLPRADDPVFEQRESGVTHTTYREETAFFSCIQRGDADTLRQMLSGMLQSGIVVGRLSDDPVRQMRYWAVCCVTLGTRYAIQGGLDEMQALSYSDRFIMKIDKMNDPGEIAAGLEKIALELTLLVKENAHRDCPAEIRVCLDYIDRHLHEPVRLSDLARLANYSEDYFSRLFKKYIGTTVGGYIMRKRLEASREMLRGAVSQEKIAYSLGFCSQTYFITCFKKAYGMTPRQYAARENG